MKASQLLSTVISASLLACTPFFLTQAYSSAKNSLAFMISSSWNTYSCCRNGLDDGHP